MTKLLTSTLLLAQIALTSCTLDVQGEYQIVVDPDCLACFPICRPDGATDCVDSAAAPCGGCRAACLGGLYMQCEEDGPHCYNHGPVGDIDVPVICNR